MATKVVTTDAGGSTEVVTLTIDELIPAKENWSGVDPNSGSVGDTRFEQRWSEFYQAGSGTTSITSGAYRVTFTNGNNNDLDVSNGGAADAGSDDWDISAGFTVITRSQPPVAGGTIYELQAVQGTTEYRIQWADNSTARNVSVIKTGSGVLFTEEVTTNNFTFRIKRSVSDVLFYVNGTLKHTDTGGISGSMSDFRFRFKQAGSRTTDAVMDTDNFTAVDGSSNDLQIDTGVDTVGVATMDA